MSASLIIDFTERGEAVAVSYRVRADESATAQESANLLAAARIVDDALREENEKIAQERGEGDVA